MKTVVIDPARPLLCTSDTHYHHRNGMKYFLRPWLSAPERRSVLAGERFAVSDESLRDHDDGLVERILTHAQSAAQRCGCRAADVVFVHAGDIAFGGAKYLCEFFDRLPFRDVYVALGNHDDDDDVQARLGDGYVFERFRLRVGDTDAVVDHYPGDAWRDDHHETLLLFGHVHGVANDWRLTNPSWQLSQDVGVDLHDHYPWDWHTEILPLMRQRRPSWANRRMSGRSKHAGGIALPERLAATT